MARSPQPSARIAVIGAGASGLYIAHELARGGFRDVRVFERSASIGGRIRDLDIGVDGAVLALGAMSFSNLHKRVCELGDHFALVREEIAVRRQGYALRGQSAPLKGEHVYRLASHERGLDPMSLLLSLIARAAPDFKKYWHDEIALWRYLAEVRPLGLSLRDLTLWDLFDVLASREAWAFMRDAIPTLASQAEAQAQAGLFTLLWECRPGQKHFRFQQGYRALAEAFVQHSPGGMRIERGHTLLRVHASKRAIELHFSRPDGSLVCCGADAAVLTCPPAALGRVSFNDAQIQAIVSSACASVNEARASKLFLGFAQPWWRALAPGGAISALSVDAPLRHCYMEASASVARAHYLLASYADGADADFWSSLAHVGAGEASAPAIRSALRQLAQASALSPPQPSGSYFIDWRASREGAAWHSWRAGVCAERVAAAVRQPNSELPLFICGEAFARPQGWIEGALNAAEMVLERHFGLARPAWARGVSPLNISKKEMRK